MGRLRVELIAARPGRAARVRLDLEEGATVRAALAAAGWNAAARGVGIYGRRVSLDTRLADGDRVEIYRALSADPKEARRRRAKPRRR
ncbi:MAG TPA: RnfH family protein [Burkholderiales bacterium]|nr:RnfH family protein [Burkholderiales bacterium]